jgi:pseudoazurin
MIGDNEMIKTAVHAMGLAMLLGAATPALASEEHVVKMLNSGSDGQFMVFEPSYLKVEPGDTVRFIATDPAHNAQTIPEIWPEGAATFKGEMSKDVTLKVEKPGVYGVKCLPHYSMGMVALVVAGDSVNADQVEAYDPPSDVVRQRIDALAGKLRG